MARPAESVPEAAFRLELDGRPLAAWSCTPDRLADLAAGWLFSSGTVRRPGDIAAIETESGTPCVARVALAPEAREHATRLLAHRRERRCGVLHALTCDPSLLQTAPAAEPPDAGQCARLLEQIYGASAQYKRTGGVHAAALVRDGRPVDVVEEIGRHNAVDKLIGAALLRETVTSGAGLVLTSRVSAEIALKAARAGIAWIVSRSVPTTLALEIAAAASTVIVARAAGSSPRTFAPAPGAA